MKIALLQWNTIWEEPPSNFEVVNQMLADLCGHEDPDLVGLPELFATGFTMNVDELAEPEKGPTCRFLQEQADRHDIYLQGSVLQKSDGRRGRNMVVIFSPDGSRIAEYTKIHPFSYADEDQYYEPGSEVITVRIRGIVVCPVICYDLRFPSLFRKGVQKGAELFLVPANWPENRLDHWKTLLRARAIENQAFVAAPNRTGTGNGLKYPGYSTLIDPWGDTVGCLGDEEGFLIGTVEKERVEEVRSSYPFLQDMSFDVS